MAGVFFKENWLRDLTPALANKYEAEIRNAVDGDAGSDDPMGCCIQVEESGDALRIGIQFERRNWGARIIVPFPAMEGEVRLSTERLLRETTFRT